MTNVPDVVTGTDLDSIVSRVKEALEDPRYEWRTVDGLVDATKLNPTDVQRALDALAANLVRSSVPDDRGRALYSTRKHYKETHGLISRFIAAVTDKVA